MNTVDEKELLSRLDNFYHKINKNVYKYYDDLLKELAEETNEILSWKESGDKKELGDEFSEQKILLKVIERIFRLTIKRENPYVLEMPDLYSVLVDACSYWMICMFVNHTKRLDSNTLPDFVYEFSPYEFNNENSPNHCKKNAKTQVLKSNEDTFRKFWNSSFRNRNMKSVREQWHAMPKDAIHEWQLYYIINSPENVANGISKTFKYLKNLPTSLKQFQEYEFTDNYEDDYVKITKSYNEYMSKQEKISFHNFLALYDLIREHINSNEKYYGINMFRLEKQLNPYTIVSDVTILRHCDTEEIRNSILMHYYLFSEISHFPDLYDYLENFDFYTAKIISSNFDTYLKMYFSFFFMVLDCCIGENVNKNVENQQKELSEKDPGLFGKNWEEVFMDVANTFAHNMYKIDGLTINDDELSETNFHNLFVYTAKIEYETKLQRCKEKHGIKD